MKIVDLLKKFKIEDSDMLEVLKSHPKQFISEAIRIPVWEVKYSYNTARGNPKEGSKYLFLEESSWDLIEKEFNEYIARFNQENPYQLSNVKILDTEYKGFLLLDLM